MKARIKATGEIVEVVVKTVTPIGSYESELRWIDKKSGISYSEDDLFLLEYICDEPDYWTRLEHQYAGMAMQGMLNNSYLAGEFRKDPNNGIEDMSKIITKAAAVYAHALVEKMKEERK